MFERGDSSIYKSSAEFPRHAHISNRLLFELYVFHNASEFVKIVSEKDGSVSPASNS